MADGLQTDWMGASLKFVKVARWLVILALFCLASMFAAEFLLNSPIVNPLALGRFARVVSSATEPVVGALKTVIKVNSLRQGFDLMPLSVAVAVYLAMVLWKNQSLRLVGWLATHRQIRRVQVAKPKAQSADGLSFSSTSTDKEGRGLLGRMGIKKEEERGKLLRELADVKKRLEESKQRLAFLSVDVVGSTRMKVGLDPLTTEHLFREYRLLLEDVFKKFRYRAASWTPDGVMACFPQVDLAYGSAKELLKRLAAFNKDKNRAGIPIQVRCGLNAGEVHYDASTPLELLSSRVLDITGHLQKAAQPDTVMITEEIYKELREKSGLMPVPDAVDGHKAYQWGAAVPKAATQVGEVATNL